MTRPTDRRDNGASVIRTSVVLIAISLFAIPSSVFATEAAFTKPLDEFTSYRDRPLFAPTRRADPKVPEHVDVPEVSETQPLNAVLLGLISTDDGAGLALLRLESQPETLRIHIGESVLGWQLTKINGHQAIFSNGTQETSLEFPKAMMAPTAAEAEQAPDEPDITPQVPDQVVNP